MTLVLSPMVIIVSLLGYQAQSLLLLWVYSFIGAARILFGIKFAVKGKPPSSGSIIACNHQSAIDPIAIFAVAPHTSFVFRNSLFISPLLRWAGMIPVGGKTGWLEKAKKTARNINICIFPEGGRYSSKDNIPYRSGVLVIAKNTLRKICPAAINSGQVWGKYSLFPSITAFGKTITLSFMRSLPHNTSMKNLEKSIKNKVKMLEQYS